MVAIPCVLRITLALANQFMSHNMLNISSFLFHRSDIMSTLLCPFIGQTLRLANCHFLKKCILILLPTPVIKRSCLIFGCYYNSHCKRRLSGTLKLIQVLIYTLKLSNQCTFLDHCNESYFTNQMHNINYYINIKYSTCLGTGLACLWKTAEWRTFSNGSLSLDVGFKLVFFLPEDSVLTETCRGCVLIFIYN
jgi:hypothetical protein